jgi:hypothetical protein
LFPQPCALGVCDSVSGCGHPEDFFNHISSLQEESVTNPNTGGSRPQTRTVAGQQYVQVVPGHVASRSGGGLAPVTVEGGYDPGDLQEIDKAIRHMPGVVAYMRQKAEECVDGTGSSNYEVVLQNDPETQRPRAYIAPANNQGIHEELSEHRALKSAIGMEGS